MLNIMDFTPHFKLKRGIAKNLNLAPFPQNRGGPHYKGVFNGLSVEVENSQEAQIKMLHDSGCYGKGSNSRGGPFSGDPEETLLLGLEEACMLSYYLGVLQIRDRSGDEVTWKSYVQAALEYDIEFIYKLAAYLYLKAKNWIIRSGIKFGGDFLIYKQGPRHYHASFLVLVQTPANNGNEYYAPKNLKGVHRVAETSDKDVLVLMVHQPQNFDPFLVTTQSMQTLTIEETVIRRFNYTSFVQSKQQ